MTPICELCANMFGDLDFRYICRFCEKLVCRSCSTDAHRETRGCSKERPYIATCGSCNEALRQRPRKKKA